MRTVLLLLLLPLLGVGVQAQPVSQTVVAPGAIWKFFNQNGDLGTAWQAEAFSDAAWASGPSPLGYSPTNADGASTTICNGCAGCTCTTVTNDCADNCGTKRITTYFRYHLNLSDATGTFAIRYQRDDGIVIYVNGTEVHRENLPASPTTITYSTTATAIPSDAEEVAWINVPTVSASLFHTGDNVIAVEIHQASATSSDIRFNMEVVRTGGTGATLTRGPYLQMGTPTEMTLRWRSSNSNTGRVRYWTTTPGSQTTTTDETIATAEHEKRLTGLIANTRYNYSIGSTDGVVLQGTTDNYFYTAPLTGTTKKTRIWALGDFGKGPGTPRQANVKNQFLNYVGNNYIDLWLWLGDNAYNVSGINDGSDAEYQSKVFDIYGPDRIMKQTPVYATPGNHDYNNTPALRTSHAIPYFDILNNFKNAEGGGVASGKEEYYSFNYGNIHVVSLDSYGYETGQGTVIFAPAGDQINWLKSDLAAAKTNPAIVWVIVFTHHPPYTMGTHNSDTESELTNIRQQLVSVLDQYKVDLLITGHSHVYERSKLMKNYLTLETDFNPAIHNAPPANNEPTPNYYYKSQQASVNEGIMYIVNGTGGADGGTQAAYPHNAMDFSINQGGSLYLEIDGAQLDGKFIGDDGLIKDQFTMIKTASPNTNTLYGTNAGISLSATSGQNTLIGYQAGQNTNSSANTFVGYQSGYTNTTGSNNVFDGSGTGGSNTTGSSNVFTGFFAGYKNTSGTQNTFIGANAGANNTTGNNNIIIGPNSGTAITNSDDNVLMGYNAQPGNGTGGHNVIIGGEAGGGLWAGASNTMIGHQAGAESMTLHHATAIGANAHVMVSNAVVLGNNANVGIGTSAPSTRLEVVSPNDHDSGLRLSKLTTSSPTNQRTDQFLTVNDRGDVIKARYQLRISSATEWSDKVFAPAYQLRPLATVATYVQENGHLPGVPSADEVVKAGVDLVRMNATLLEKVEELTLYLIQQQKRIEQLENQIEQVTKP